MMKDQKDNPKIAQLYQGVPAELVTRLTRFRAQYPYKQAEIRGTEWRYIDTAQGKAPLLVLLGAACIAETSWQSIEHFAQRYRVIAPDYPAIDTMTELVDGIAAILDQEGIPQAHVLGGSYGGLVAQEFVRQHPSRTASLILSHTLLPQREGAAQITRALRWMRLLPAPLLRALFQARLGRLFGDGQHPAEDDPATPEPIRQAIMAMYPQAQVRLFSGSGHMTAVLQQDEYFAAMDEFLTKAVV